MTFGSLFSGFGGLDIGLEKAGMECRWQVEINEYARLVLAKHWPDVRKHDDVRTWPMADTETVDVICGGFPCQDISSANQSKVGIIGKRSGLWSEYHRIINQVRPRVVIIENVSSLLVRGMDRVLSDLAESGFDAGWRVFCSSEFGFPFMRKRVFLVASSDGSRKSIESIHAKVANVQTVARDSWVRSLRDVAGSSRATDGIRNGFQRCRGLGNAVVPQIAEWIGRQIMASASEP